MKENQSENKELRRTNRHRNGKQEKANDEPKSRIKKRNQINKGKLNDNNLTDIEQDDEFSKKKKTRPRENTEQKEPENKKFFTVKRVLFSIATVIVLALITYTTILFGGKMIVDQDKLIITPPTTIETADGEIIWYLYDQFRLPVKIDEVPDHVKEAFVIVEDKRFYTHSGVDLRSIVRAVYRDIVARDKVEGASTITQQLAKNLFLTNDKSWWRKIKEAMIALYLEREYSKDELLEMYLNVVYFGQGQYGIEAAANRFFHKTVSELTIEEGALLAGLIKAPNSYSPIDDPEKAKNRRDVVLQLMSDAELITEKEFSQAKKTGINLNLSQRKFNPAYHTYIDLVIREAMNKYNISLDELKNNRYRLITTLDEKVQEIAFEQFQYDGYFPGNDKETVQGSFVMMEQDSGQIVAAIGGRKYQVGDLNRVLEKRQPGSTMKPLAVYAPALQSEKFEPYSLIPDELTEWDGHEVRNHDNYYEGQVSIYNALIKSKNTSAYWLLNEIGIDYSKTFLEKAGINIEDDNLGISLGALKKGVTPLEMVQGYRTFIHSGEKVDAYTITEIYDRTGKNLFKAKNEAIKVFDDQVAWSITEMLQEVIVSGTGRAGEYPYELAGKTGTTQHPHVEGRAKDIWFVGYTPDYVTALWMGYDKSDKDHYLIGGSDYPTQLTKKILTEVTKVKPVKTAFEKPDNVKALAEPVSLPDIKDLTVNYQFGGFKLVNAKLTWTPGSDKRVNYHIYERNGSSKVKIGEVVNSGEFVIDKFVLFQKSSYYIVPVDPLTGLEGTVSNEVQLNY